MYVTNSYSNNVSVINSTKVVTTIPVGSYPAGVAYDSANGYVYVANQGSNTVSAISTFMPPASPSAPRNLIASPGVGRVVLTWQAPVSDGGAPITSYAVRRGTWSGTTTLHLGTNVIYARATDTSGNQATVQITVTVAGYGPTGLDPVILATILVALGAVGVAMTLIAWKRRKTTQSP